MSFPKLRRYKKGFMSGDRDRIGSASLDEWQIFQIYRQERFYQLEIKLQTSKTVEDVTS